jgi:hypothetical protein
MNQRLVAAFNGLSGPARLYGSIVLHDLLLLRVESVIEVIIESVTYVQKLQEASGNQHQGTRNASFIPNMNNNMNNMSKIQACRDSGCRAQLRNPM